MSPVTRVDDPRSDPRVFMRVPHDVWLVLMTVIWGANYSVVKSALEQLEPRAFNSVRLGLASMLFLASLAASRRRLAGADGTPITKRDWLAIAALGVIGHFIYQMCFMGGISETSVANTSLILGCSPVAVALLTAAVGQERVTRAHWIGVALSVGGIYLLVGRGARLSGESLRGDALALCGVVCWAAYTVAARPLLARHSALVVTGYSMAIGSALYAAASIPQLASADWMAVSASGWISLAFSAVFALYVSYLIWYRAVQRIGNVRTSIYSNLTPIIGLVVAALWLHEPVTVLKIVGAAAILSGVGFTRISRAREAPPAEE